MRVTHDIVIIGGGASGLCAAITAKRRGLSVLLLEANERVGKKLLATGNGRCNLTNVHITPECYNDAGGMRGFLVDKDKIPAFFHTLGLVTREIEGRVYPYSESAATVLNLLRKAADGVETVTGVSVEQIEGQQGAFCINGVYYGKNVLLATGSRATFGRNSHNLYRPFGHTVTPLFPAIVPLISDISAIRGLAGVRVKGNISLIWAGEPRAERGEILFKDNGVSGIAAMSLSSHIAREEKACALSIDFVPDKGEKELERFLENGTVYGLLQTAVADRVLEAAMREKRSVAAVLKDFRIQDVRLGSEKQAQVLSGGIPLAEFDEGLESKCCKGLYAAGEVLDVDGDCGGYNLFWAFLSGITVGESIC